MIAFVMARAGWVPYLLVAASVVWAIASGDPVLLHVTTLFVIFSLWGSSLNIVWGYGGQFSMAQVALGAIGAYGVAVLTVQYDWNYWLALLVSIVIGVLLSLIIGWVALRLTGFYFAIMTLAFASLVLQLLSSWERVGLTTGMSAGFALGSVDIGPVHWDLAAKDGGLLTLATIALFLTLATIGKIEKTRTGRALAAVREDRILGSSLGINGTFYSALAFAASAVVAVVSGALYGAYLLFIAPSFFGLGVVISLIAIVVIGGAGHKFGPVVGAAIYIAVTEYFKWGGEHGGALFGVLLVVMMLVAPAGLLGYSSFWRSPLQRFRTARSEPGGDIHVSQASAAEGKAR
ncbi:high-affinity branched-chain amino acid ABC transporter permease LivM [Nocardioides hungaricus]